MKCGESRNVIHHLLLRNSTIRYLKVFKKNHFLLWPGTKLAKSFEYFCLNFVNISPENMSSISLSIIIIVYCSQPGYIEWLRTSVFAVARQSKKFLNLLQLSWMNFKSRALASISCRTLVSIKMARVAIRAPPDAEARAWKRVLGFHVQKNKPKLHKNSFASYIHLWKSLDFFFLYFIYFSQIFFSLAHTRFDSKIVWSSRLDDWYSFHGRRDQTIQRKEVSYLNLARSLFLILISCTIPRVPPFCQTLSIDFLFVLVDSVHFLSFLFLRLVQESLISSTSSSSSSSCFISPLTIIK